MRLLKKAGPKIKEKTDELDENIVDKIYTWSKFGLQVGMACIPYAPLGATLATPVFDLIYKNLQLQGFFKTKLSQKKKKELRKIINESIAEVTKKLTDEQKKFIESAWTNLEPVITGLTVEKLASPQPINDEIENILKQHAIVNPSVLPENDLMAFAAFFLKCITQKVKESELLGGTYNNCLITELRTRIDKISSTLQDHTQTLQDHTHKIGHLDERLDGLSGLPLPEFHPEVYRANSKERFDVLKTGVGKFYDVLYEDNKYMPMTIIEEGSGGNVERYIVEKVLTKLNERGCRYAILTGEGGMGKTTTCMRLWDICLKNNLQVFYVPLCEYSSANAIHSHIVNVYGVEENNYNRLMNEADVVLLLDGFNEMKIEHNFTFLEELNALVAKKRLQVLITSRNDVMPHRTSGFTKLTFESLKEKVIDEWLENHAQSNKKPKINSELYAVLGNPMLLKIYALNLKEPKKSSNIQATNFLKDPVTTGEIIWNFLEHQILLNSDSREKTGYSAKFLFRWLLPYIAYKMEFQEKFHFTKSELKQYIDEFVAYVKCLDALNDLIIYEAEIQTLHSKLSETENLLKLCVDSFSIIELKPVKSVDDDTYSFIHQYFRDIFSATHIKNQMKLCDKSVFTKRLLPLHISQMLLEILQEHKVIKSSIREYEWLKPSGNVSELREYLRCFKGDKEDDAQKGVFNALRIIDYSCKSDLTWEDFSGLDLRMCSLTGKNVRKSSFTESYVCKGVFFSRGHTSRLRPAYFSPDGKYLATASFDNTVKIWEWEMCLLKHTIQHASAVFDVCFSPDGKHCASVSSDGVMQVWEWKTGKLIHTKQHPETTRRVCFSSDSEGKHLAITLGNTVEIWDWKNDKLIQTLSHTNFVHSVCFCSDSEGKHLSTASRDGTVKIWDSKNGKQISCQKAVEGSVCFSPDGKYLAFQPDTGVVQVWEWRKANSTPIYIPQKHQCSIPSMCFSPDGKYLAISSYDAVEVWEWRKANSTPIYTLQYSLERVEGVCFSPDSDGKYLAISSYDAVEVWEWRKDVKINTIQNRTSVRQVRFSPDGKYLAISSYDAVQVWEWGKRDSKLIQSIKNVVNSTVDMCFSPDGKYLAFTSDENKTVKVCELGSENGKIHTTQHHDYVPMLCFSPDGKYLAFISNLNYVKTPGDWGPNGNAVKVWEWGSEDGKIHTTQQLGIMGIMDNLCFSSDGKHVIFTMAGVVLVWEWGSENGKIHTTQHPFTVADMYFSPDSGGKYLATASGGTVEVWEWGKTDNKLIQSIKNGRYTDHVCFSPDGKYLAFTSYEDKTVKVWEWGKTDNKLIQSIKNVRDVMDICFSPDGKYLALTSEDNTVQIYERKSRLLSKSWRLIALIHPLSYIEILGANLRGINRGDLTDDDILILKQNGAITD